MTTDSPNYWSEFFASKTSAEKNIAKQIIVIDLQSDEDSTLSTQKSQCLFTTSNLSKQIFNVEIQEKEYFDQSLQNKANNKKKDLYFQNAYLKNLPTCSLIEPSSSLLNMKKYQKVLENQESFIDKPKKSRFSDQPRFLEIKKIQDGSLIKQKQKKQQLNSGIQTSIGQLFVVDQAQQMTLRAIHSCQHFQPIQKKEAQTKSSLKLKRKTRSHTKKYKDKIVMQISSQDYTQSSFNQIELFQASAYRFRIPNVAQNIRKLFEEVQKNKVIYMARAAVKQSPRYLINSLQHKYIKSMRLKQLEKRRIIYLE